MIFILIVSSSTIDKKLEITKNSKIFEIFVNFEFIFEIFVNFEFFVNGR